MLEYTDIVVEKKPPIGYITINRPERRNAIDPKTSRELLVAWSEFREDPDLWVGILTGAGEKAFSAGADLVAMSEAMAGSSAVPVLRASRPLTWRGEPRSRSRR